VPILHNRAPNDSYSRFVLKLRIVVWLGIAGLAVWWARLMAHAKLPPPEGRWREVSERELQ
jgi:hypothetical protein